LKDFRDAFQIVTYDDLLRDKDLMRAMKLALLECSEQDLVEERPEWAGKTIYQFFSGSGDKAGSLTTGSTTTGSTATGSPATGSPTGETNVEDIVVGRCLLEHDLSGFAPPTTKADCDAKSAMRQFSDIVQVPI
jgi:hypothetical protein